VRLSLIFLHFWGQLMLFQDNFACVRPRARAKSAAACSNRAQARALTWRQRPLSLGAPAPSLSLGARARSHWKRAPALTWQLHLICNKSVRARALIRDHCSQQTCITRRWWLFERIERRQLDVDGGLKWLKCEAWISWRWMRRRTGVEDWCDRNSMLGSRWGGCYGLAWWLMLGFRGDGCHEASVEVGWSRRRLGFRSLELGFRSLNSVEVNARKPAFDVTKARSSKAWESIQVDAARPRCAVNANHAKSSIFGFLSNYLHQRFIPELLIMWAIIWRTTSAVTWTGYSNERPPASRLESGFRRNFCETVWVREKSAPGLTAIILPCDLQSPAHGLSSWSCWRARVQLVQEAGVIWK